MPGVLRQLHREPGAVHNLMNWTGITISMIVLLATVWRLTALVVWSVRSGWNALNYRR